MAIQRSLPKWVTLLIRFLPPAGLVIGGMLVCMHFGFRGLFAIDQSIVWHGAARWMNGEMFVNDIRTPNGFTPIAMQAIVFRIFGMNWWSYVFHAGLMNGLFGLVAYAILRRLEGPRWLAFLFAALSTLAFYAPMGTPFMDQHAFFFSLWAVMLAMTMKDHAKWKRRIEFSLLPIAILLGALSKQIPTAFFLPVIAFVMATRTPKALWREAATSILIGMAFALVLLCWWFPPWKTDFTLLRLTLFELPSSVGGERWAKLGFHKPFGLLRTLLTEPFHALNHRKEFYRILFLVLIIGSAMVPLLLRLQPRLHRPAFKPLIHLPSVLLIHLAGALSLLLTLNDRENSIPFVFITLGGIAAIILKMGSESNGRRIATGAAAVAVVFLLANGSWDAAGFWKNTLETRKVNDFKPGEYDGKGQRIHPWIIPQLSGLQPQGPLQYSNHRVDVLIRTLRGNKKRFLLWSDYSLVYDICGQRNPLPWLWLHPGLTLPEPGSEHFPESDSILAAALQGAEMLVYDTPDMRTYMQADLHDYPRSIAWVESHSGPATEVGGFWIRELHP